VSSSAEPQATPPRSRALAAGSAVAFAIGSVGLIGALSVDFVSVLGRHAGLPLVGSIEIVQLFVVLAASASLVGATLARVHASVAVLTERLPPSIQRGLGQFGALCGAAFFAALLAGGVWLIADTWRLDEKGELLGLPILPLRLVWAAACALTAALFLVQAFRPPPERPPHVP
jgi:TRAP-type transport system small permease protein